MNMNNPYEKAVQAILYGHSYAMRLKLQLDDPTTDNGSVPRYDLAKSIVDCFSNAISNLSSDKPKSEDDQFSDLSSSRDSSPSCPQISHSKKRKIRSTSSSENWRDDSPDPLYYDGFLWRKYGQKYIKNSDHQRSYYRCSYNKDDNCGARKHEQKIKNNPPVYRTTYFGHHSCKINRNQDVIFTNVLDPVDDLESAQMIRFGKHLHHQKKNGSTLSVKDEEEDFMKKEIKDHDQDSQHVTEENLSSGSGSESCVYDSELLWDINPASWDPYDQFDFGILH